MPDPQWVRRFAVPPWPVRPDRGRKEFLRSTAVQADLQPVVAALEKEFPQDWKAEDNGERFLGNKLFEYGIYRRSEGASHVPITLAGNGQRVGVTFPFVFRGRGGFVFECGHWDDDDPHATADVTLSTGLQLRSDWSVAAVDPSVMVTTTNCFDAKADNFLSKFATETFKPRIDTLFLEQPGLVKTARTFWHALQTPISIGPDLWLLPHPEAITLAPITFTGTKAGMSIHVDATPEIVFSSKTPPADKHALPLKSDGIHDNRFQVALYASFHFRELAAAARRVLLGQTITIGKRSVVIADVDAFGTGKEVVLAVTVDGKKLRGTFYLQGTPVFLEVTANGAQNVLTWENLRFTAETDSFVTKVASWFARRHVEKWVRERLTISMQPYVDDWRAQVHTSLNTEHGDVRLNGSLEQFDVGPVYTQPEGLLVRVRSRGRLNAVF